MLTARTNNRVAKSPEGWAEKKLITHSIRSNITEDQMTLFKGPVEKVSGHSQESFASGRKFLRPKWWICYPVWKARCDEDKGPVLKEDYCRRGGQGIRANIEGSAFLLPATREKISDGPERPYSTSDG